MSSRRYRRWRKISDYIVEEMRRDIASYRLKPGDRLPGEAEIMSRFNCAKSTARETLKVLEVEGLIRTRTGPNGGAYLLEAGVVQIERALRNYLYFQHLTMEQLCQLRKLVETELAVSVVGHLDQQDFVALEASMTRYHDDDGGVPHACTFAGLEFHDILARACPNPLLKFNAICLNGLLRDMVVVPKVSPSLHEQFDERTLCVYRDLLDALQAQDGARVRQLMYGHMCEVDLFLQQCEARIEGNFLDGKKALQKG